VKCFGGCDWKMLRRQLGLGVEEPVLERQPSFRYVYYDEHWNPLYANLRFVPKDFRVEHWDGKKFAPGLNGCRKVLFNLPYLRKYPGARVILVEGEKDAMTATVPPRTVGVCILGGAGGQWLPEYTEQLAGRKVTIVADADEVGMKAAWYWAGKLWRACAELSVVEFAEGAPKGFDLSDALGKAEPGRQGVILVAEYAATKS